MRFASRFLIPAFIGLSLALTESSVFIFQGDRSHNKVAPVLSPEQARLIFAHRLGLSKNYELADVSESTLSYINQFGKTQFSLFEPSDDGIAELVLIVEGLSSKTAKPLFTALPSSKPDFYVSKFHGSISPKLIASEFLKYMGKEKSFDTLKTLVTPNEVHRPLSSNIIYLDFHNDTDVLDQLINAQSKILSVAKQRKMNTALFLIQEVNPTAANKISSSEQNEKILASRKATEEPMITDLSVLSSPLKQVFASSPSNKTYKGPLQLCYKSLDSCIRSTRNCSGHGECSSKHKDNNEKGACFSCTCSATNETITWAKGTRKGWTINYWGGSACHKQDISSAFWLITIFTIVITGVVGWGITMLYSIGEEKLPGVIGAGVSNSKTRGS
ncbi:putative endoplasmic reticulum membrane protein [Golovinomyces cichoracearum]|uniref:Putative endoplasmic reticulum membrane protein n=1 Tax=Golovinomyces cichoracearum TaxID=62708 RepID=A0A420IU03_9PEZI|nr:putative endoplasmic reticulum membrane protein [Golovinomyces cichoracearum]